MPRAGKALPIPSRGRPALRRRGQPVEQVQRFQEELREHLRTEKSAYEAIRSERELGDELQETLRGEIEKFAKTFSVREESLV